MRQCYIIMHPAWVTHTNSHNWSVLKRNDRRELEKVGEVTSYESAVAMLPSGLVRTGKVFELEFWEGQSSSATVRSCQP